MKMVLLVAFILIASSGNGIADDNISREETFNILSEKLAELEVNSAQIRYEYQQAWGEGSLDFKSGVYTALEGKIQSALQQAEEIRAFLTGNPYVQVSGFTVGFPWGISIEFTMPPPADEGGE